MATASLFDDLNQSVDRFAFEIKESAKKLAVAPAPDFHVSRSQFVEVASICEKARLGVWSAFQIAYCFPRQWNRDLIREFESAINKGAEVTQWHYRRNVIERQSDLKALLETAERSDTETYWLLALNAGLHFVRREFVRESTAQQDEKFGYTELTTLCLDIQNLVQAALSGAGAKPRLGDFVGVVKKNMDRLAELLLLRSPKKLIKAEAQKLFAEIFQHLESLGEFITDSPHENTLEPTTWEDELIHASKSLASFSVPETHGEFANLIIDDNEVAQITEDVLSSDASRDHPNVKEDTTMVEDIPETQRFDVSIHDEFLQKELEIRRAYADRWVAYRILRDDKNRKRIEVVESAATEEELDCKLDSLGFGDLSTQHKLEIHVKFCSTRIPHSPFGFLNTPGRH